MFGWLIRKPEKVEFLNVEGRIITFGCSRKYKEGATVRIQLSLPNDDCLQEFVVPVTVRSVRQTPGKGFICSAEVPSRLKGEEQLRALLLEAKDKLVPESGEFSMRRRVRHRYSLRVMSKELPGFRAISVDINQLGIQIAAEGPAEVGSVLPLTLELGATQNSSVLLQARVKWCREVARRSYRMGLEFENLSPEIEAELDRFEKFLVQRGQGNVTQRQLIDSRRFVSTEDLPVKDQKRGSHVVSDE